MAKRRTACFRSGYEQRVADNLKKITNITVEYESDRLQYLRDYVPDFKVVLADGSYFFIEAKGWFDRDSKYKMLRVKEYNPDVDIRILLQRGTGKQGSSNIKWCERHGFQYAIGETIPEEWLDAGTKERVLAKPSKKKEAETKGAREVQVVRKTPTRAKRGSKV